MATGSLRSAGMTGRFWSGSAFLSTLDVYYLDFNNLNILPSSDNYRWIGFTVQIP